MIPIPTQTDAKPVPLFIGHEAVAKPIVIERPVPQNPFLGEGYWSSHHNDTYQSDTYPAAVPGPLGHNPIVTSNYVGTSPQGLTPLVGMMFGKDGRLMASRIEWDATGQVGWQVLLVDPDSLAVLDVLELPKETPYPGFTFPVGAYGFLDKYDNYVIAASDKHIWVIPHTLSGFDRDNIKRYDVTGAIPAGDDIRMLFPDFSGRVWFATRFGLIGTLALPEYGGDFQVLGTLQLEEGEEIENAWSADEDGGMYVPSSKYLYRFDADATTGAPTITWREPYDTGAPIELIVSDGSGTTPTLMGKDYVVIGDKALPQMHVLVYRRAKVLAPGQQRLVCAVPVFQPGQSFTENSMMATDRSIVLENNAGYDRDPKVVEQGRTTKPGFVRVDINDDGNGCHIVWTHEEINPILAPKLSLATGLIYALTKPRGPANTDAWYFTAIDFATGDVVYKVLAGPGRLWNSHMGCGYLDRTGAAFYGTLGGMVKIQDGPPD